MTDKKTQAGAFARLLKYAIPFLVSVTLYIFFLFRTIDRWNPYSAYDLISHGIHLALSGDGTWILVTGVTGSIVYAVIAFSYLHTKKSAASANQSVSRYFRQAGLAFGLSVAPMIITYTVLARYSEEDTQTAIVITAVLGMCCAAKRVLLYGLLSQYIRKTFSTILMTLAVSAMTVYASFVIILTLDMFLDMLKMPICFPVAVQAAVFAGLAVRKIKQRPSKSQDQ